MHHTSADSLKQVTNNDVAIAIRGVAEMEAPSAESLIRLDPNKDEY